MRDKGLKSCFAHSLHGDQQMQYMVRYMLAEVSELGAMVAMISMLYYK